MDNVRDMMHSCERCDGKNYYKCASTEEVSHESSFLNQNEQQQLRYNNKSGFKEGLLFPIAKDTNPPLLAKKSSERIGAPAIFYEKSEDNGAKQNN